MTLESIYMIADAKRSFFLHEKRIIGNVTGKSENYKSCVEKIEIDAVIKYFKYNNQKENLLENVSIKAMLGDIILITGPNGSGKTSLINILSGVIPEIYNGDYDIEWKIPQLSKEFIGCVFQGIGNYLFFEAPENQLSHIDPIIAAYWFKEFGLNYSDIYTRSCADFSNGEQQRLALIAELLDKDKYVIFLDEPTAFLDTVGKQKLLKLIKQQSQTKIIFIISHDKECFGWANKFYEIVNRTLKEGKWMQAYNGQRIKGEYKNKILTVIKDDLFPDGKLVVHENDFICCTGANGIGKTTVAYQIFGQLQKEKNISSAFMLQKFEHQIFQTTVMDELMMGVEKNEYNKNRAIDYLTELKLQEYINEAPQFLSGGQKRVIIILCLLMKKPSVLLLDEPLSSLDTDNTNRIINLLIREYEKNNMTIIIFDQTNSCFANVCGENTIRLGTVNSYSQNRS